MTTEGFGVTRKAGVAQLVAGWVFLRRWPVISVAIIGMLIFLGIFGPMLPLPDPLDVSLRNVKAPPFWYEEGSTSYLLGTDVLGRDVLSRMISATRVTLVVAVVALFVGGMVGILLGLVAGYIGGQIDEIIMRLYDVWLGLPFLLVALVVVVVLEPSLGVIIALLAAVAWTPFVRNVRAETLALKTRDYVLIARISGASNFRIIYRHILPGVVNTIVVIASLNVGGLVLTEAALSFLGAGIPPPNPTWGGMVAEGRNHLADTWWISTLPGIGIFLTVLAFNFLGDWTRDHFDPRLRQI